MKGMVLLVVGVLLLAAAAGGGYYAYITFIAKPAESEAEKKPPKPPPEPPPVYVRLQPLEVPVVGADRVTQLITLVVALRVKDQFAADSVSARMPRVMDTFLTTLYGAIDEGDVMDGNVISIAGIKRRLLAVSEQFLGKGVVVDVLVQTVLQRRL